MIQRPVSTAMIDLLLGTIMLLLLQINPPELKATEEPKGKFKIEMAWDDSVDIDMDIYLRLPQKKGTIWYSWKDRQSAYITRDDMGLQHGDLNFETIWIQTPLDGEYCLSVHNFSMNPNQMMRPTAPNENKVIKGDVEVRLTDDRSNTLYKMVKPMPNYKVEFPYFCFNMKDGKFISAKPSTEKIQSTGEANAN